MKKRKNEFRRNTKQQVRHSQKGIGLKIVEHPLNSVDRGTLKTALVALAKKQIREFPDHLATISNIFRAKYPPQILATVVSYGLYATVSAKGVASKTMIPRLEQHHVELLQALILMLPIEEWGTKPGIPEDIQRVIDTIIKLATAFNQRRFLVMEQQRNRQEGTVLGLQERLRIHTQEVRNWGHFSQVVQISAELYAPLDEGFRKTHGFGATDVINVARVLVSTIEGRTKVRFAMLRHILSARTIPRLVRQYYKHYPDVEGDPDKFIKHIPLTASLDSVRARLLAHADLALPKVAIIAIDEVASGTGLSPDVVTRILRALSLRPGALQQKDPEHLFLSNPVWTAPIISFGDEYFCPMPHAVFSHIHDVMRPLAEVANLKAALEKRRADYLEDKMEAVIRAALPSSKCRRNTRWRNGPTEYETDLIAVIDRVVIIVEGKSATLSAAGLRGAPDRVKRHVRDLILDPSEQSARLETAIWRAKAGDPDAVAGLGEFGIAFAEVDAVVRISVTLDDFSILASAELELKAAGWMASDMRLAPTLNIADFESVGDILDRPAYFVHYFLERDRFQKSMVVLAHEMEFLGFYLETGFCLWEFEDQGGKLAMTKMSKTINHYYSSKEAGLDVRKPELKLRPYFSALIDRVQARAFPGWLTVAIDLLRVANYNEQTRIERAMATLKSNVQRNWRTPGQKCCVVIKPPLIRETIVIFYVFPQVLVRKRREVVDRLVSEAFDKHDRDRCIVVGRNTDRWDVPYIFILVAKSDKERI